MDRFLPIFNRVFGVKPGPEKPKLERLLWFRGYYLRYLALMAPACALLLTFLPPWILAIVVLPWVLGFARLNLELRSERRRRRP
jgi:uncharacterized membrane protein YdbT with pleckstrin-like domain